MAQIGFEEPAGSGLYGVGDVQSLGGGFYSTDGFAADPDRPGLYFTGPLATTAPVLTFLPGDPGSHLAPRVEVVATLFESGAVTATFYRSDGSRTWTVRGGVRRSVAGGVALVDWEAPFGVPVTYRAEQFDAAGLSMGFTDSASIVLNIDEVWVQHVLEPSIAVLWSFTDDAIAALERPAEGSFMQVEGAAVAKWVGSRRTGLTEVNLSGVTETLTDAAVFDSMFGTYEQPRIPILVFRAPPILRLPPTLIAQVRVVRAPMSIATVPDFDVWVLKGTEVEPPAVGLVEATLTWDDLAAAYGSWDEVAAAYSSWLDASRDYSLAGLAG
jgi:hypothetical protein